MGRKAGEVVTAPLDIKRLPDWKPRLVAYLGSVADRALKPGKHDCALFFAGAVKAMTGYDGARGWRSKYKSLAGGVKALKKAGHDDHIALVASVLKEIPPAFAREGDGAVVPGEGALDALGIVQGEGVYVLTPQRMAIVSRSQILRAFRV